MGVTFSNNAVAKLTSFISPSDTTIVIDQTAAERFPVATNGKTWFYATIVDTIGNLEIVKCTNRSYGSLTVVRGQGGTRPKEFDAGSSLEIRVTANLLSDLAQKDEFSEHTTEIEGDLDALVTALNSIK